MRNRSNFSSFLCVLTLAALGCGDSGSSGGGGNSSGGENPGGGGNGGEAGQGGTAEGGGGMASGGGGAASGGGGIGGIGTGGMATGGAGGIGTGGMAAGGMGTGGAGGMAGMSASEQIAVVTGTADGTGLTLPIEGAIVTYVKPVLGTDPAGFFLQAEQMGPAVFVGVDPATLSPVPAIGDSVDLTVTSVITNAGLKQVDGVTGFAVNSSNNPVAPLVTDITAAMDVVSGLNGYSARAVSFLGEIDGPFNGAGAPQVAAKLLTSLDSPDLRFRLPEAVRAQYDLTEGCLVDVDYGVMWRFNAVAQPSVVDAADIVDVTCDAPVVESAIAASPTTVVITFSRNVDPASVMANGSQFTFNGGLTANMATVSGNTVTVTTTTPQTPGFAYTVTVAATVEDTLDTPIGAAMMTNFTGFLTPAVLKINEINANITGNCDLIELRVISGGSIGNFTLTERDLSILTLPDMIVATNDIIVVHINSPSATCNPGNAVNETMAKNQFPVSGNAKNYDLAWDFWSADTNLTSTDNVFQIRDAIVTIQDAVLVADNPDNVNAAAASEAAAAVVAAANQWFTLAGMIPAGGYVDGVFRANAVQDLNGTATDALGTGLSIQRLNTDDNDMGDWTMAAQTWGALNLGQ